MNHAAPLANLAWLGANTAGWRRFRAALGRVRRTQEAILGRYLRDQAGSAYGRAHRFSRLRTADDYRGAVPLTSYDDYVPLIEKIAAGETHVLTREPVKLFEPSSGSTRAAKWIPYTASLQAEFRRAVAPWAFDLFSRRPRLLGGPAYWSITPLASRTDGPAGAVPVGFEEDSAYLGGGSKRLVDAALAVPGAVRRIRDLERFQHVSLVFLLRCRALRLISVWHPTFLSLLMARLESTWDSLLADLEGGLRIPEAESAIPGDRSRARELAAIGPERLGSIWPHLGLISCWGDGPAAPYVDEIARLFPGVEIQAKGLIATEAFVSLPFGWRRPLAVTSHFFEFLEPSGRSLLAHELEVGRQYSVVVTTGGGLYRYRLQDRIEVTGFLEEAPCLRFLGKEDKVADLFGEKLSEGFVAAALARVFDGFALRPRFAMLSPEKGRGAARYVLHLEAPVALPAGLAGALEAALRQNPNYDYCIRLGQLGPVQVRAAGDGAYERYVGRLVARGQRLGAIKPSPLSALDEWSGFLEQNIRPGVPGIDRSGLASGRGRAAAGPGDLALQVQQDDGHDQEEGGLGHLTPRGDGEGVLDLLPEDQSLQRAQDEQDHEPVGD